jgi:ABC-type nitrate/sulfonate/bicarbonate transport system substrate-binding protein
MAKHKRLVAMFGAAAIFVGACAGGASPTPSASSPASQPASQAPSEPASASPDGAASEEPSGSAGGSAAALPTPEKTDLQMGLSVTETSQYAAQLALDAGIYEKNGLNVEIAVFEGDGRVQQALQAGQLDVGFGGVSGFITAQTSDVPVDALAVNATILSDLLVSTAEITDAEALRGQCVAVSTFGGTSHGAVILALEALGLTSDDVVIQEVGGQSNRIAALQGGSCAAAPVDEARREEMEGFGFNVLVNLKEEGLAWGRSGMGVTEDWLAENPNTALVVAASVLEAQNMMWEDIDTAARHYAEFVQISEDEARALIEDFQEIGNRDLMWTDEAFENPKRVLATVNPEIEPVPVSDAYNTTVLDQLEQMGIYESLGVPIEGQ